MIRPLDQESVFGSARARPIRRSASDVAASATTEKQKRPAEAGRFELNESFRTLVDQRARGIAGGDSSQRLASLRSNRVLKLHLMPQPSPASEGSLT